jgi:exodeoxyribonuclease VII small subunit
VSAKDKPSITTKTAKLNELLAWFDSEEFSLEQALDKFAEAEKLAEDIEKDLASLKNDITIVKAKFNGA